MKREAGFTLIELMIVVLIIGILAAIALPNYVRMKENARRASCISNQRNIGEQALIYSSENNVGTVTINVSVLTGLYLTQDVGECPESGTLDYDDYSIEITNYQVTDLTCSIRPVEHDYTLPN